MAWVEITEDDFNRKMAGPETTALKTKVLAVGQPNPLPEIIADTVELVRGYVGNSNTLAEGAKIPSKLMGTALSIIRFELATRLPVATLLTDDRRKSYDNAISLLRDVAAGKFSIEEPETPSEEETISPGSFGGQVKIKMRTDATE